ncbi:uncharacterized protein LOC111366856 [Olea europaea var. sylvestris]|uniref:uncharacterized protein LOC111366856 n=1 Tax=Olea europaea var. sylvestris TaxID=158386 RepID=UPI000C1D24D2|nr:uncharacterized protein LOC111366856 [Olea europaea var. sylvestris]
MNEKHFAHISSRVESASKKLDLAHLELYNDRENLHLKCEVVRLRKEENTLCEAERSSYYQKAKCVHLKNSDKCTKYFYSLPKRNVKRNFIPAILKRDGFYSTSLEEVGTEFTHFYSELLGRKTVGQHASVDVIRNGPMLSEENASLLVRDFTRPIACCNVFYKVITKILASRLKPMLDSIVDQAQSAFVEGRSMIENIHLAQELLRQYNRKRVAPRCLLKIDLTKAFDSVN